MFMPTDHGPRTTDKSETGGRSPAEAVSRAGHKHGVVFHSNNARPHKPIPVFENSPTFQMACRQLEMAAEQIELDRGILERLSKPKRAMVVSVPIELDNGRIEGFVGYRVQHSLTSGPSKGGLRYHS